MKYLSGYISVKTIVYTNNLFTVTNSFLVTNMEEKNAKENLNLSEVKERIAIANIVVTVFPVSFSFLFPFYLFVQLDLVCIETRFVARTIIL